MAAGAHETPFARAEQHVAVLRRASECALRFEIAAAVLHPSRRLSTAGLHRSLEHRRRWDRTVGRVVASDRDLPTVVLNLERFAAEQGVGRLRRLDLDLYRGLEAAADRERESSQRPGEAGHERLVSTTTTMSPGARVRVPARA
jgi:hypothetical protein